MSGVEIGLAGIAAVVLLMAIRIPIAISLILVSFVGMWVIRGFDVAVGLIRTVPFDFSAHWSLTAIPMFLLMGAITFHSGISKDLFRAARLWLGGLPGGLAIAANFSCAGFSAASGSSVATAAAMGRIAVPEMLKHGYDKGLSTGVVASAGTLGSLIPPSILFVLYGVFAQVSIPKLFIAGLLPGILTAVIYAIMIVARCKLDPKVAPSTKIETTRAERWEALLAIWPLLALVLGIIGGLYAGIITPTEAGAFGAFLAFVIAILQRRLTWKGAWDSIFETIVSNARIFLVAIGAVLFAKFLPLTGLPHEIGLLVQSNAIDKITLVLVFSVIFIILGMFLDPIGVMLLSLPVLLPVVENSGFDPIWFGVIVIKFLEIGLLTPPVGFNVYVISSVVGDAVPLETIFRGVLWFLACEVVVVILLVGFPEISLFLPGLMD
jgi:tripartite ATP-independent transporter DctM subunit